MLPWLCFRQPKCERLLVKNIQCHQCKFSLLLVVYFSYTFMWLMEWNYVDNGCFNLCFSFLYGLMAWFLFSRAGFLPVTKLVAVDSSIL